MLLTFLNVGRVILARRSCKTIFVLVPKMYKRTFWKSFYHLSKMLLQGTIVPGRLRSELCAWEVNIGRNFAHWYFLYDDGRHDGGSDVSDIVMFVTQSW